MNTHKHANSHQVLRPNVDGKHPDNEQDSDELLDDFATRAARVSSIDFGAFFQANPVPLGIGDASGNLLFLNTAAFRTIGVEPDCGIGQIDPTEVWNPALGREILQGLKSTGTWEGQIAFLVSGREVQRKASAFAFNPGFGIQLCHRSDLQVSPTTLEGERRFQTLAESIPQLVWEADATGRVQYYNKRIDQLAGAEWHPETGMWTWQAVLHPDDLASTVSAWAESVKTGKPYDIEHRVRMKDGTFRWQISRATPLMDEEGNVIRWLGTATDIHSSKLEAELMQKDELRLRLAQQAGRIGIWEWDPSEGEYGTTFWSEEMWSIYGYDPGSSANPEELFRKSIHPEDYPGFTKRMLEMVEAGREKISEDFRIRRPDGSIRWIRCLARVIRNAEGEVERMIGVNLDTTESRNTEEALRQRAEELEQLMNVAPVAIWVSQDAECRHVTGNRMANRLYRAEQAENVSSGEVGQMDTRGPRRFFSTDGVPISPGDLPMQRAVSLNAEVANAEVIVELEGGDRITIFGSAVPLRDKEGGVRGCLAAFLDITERTQSERDLRESELRFRTMADGLPAIVWMHDAKGKQEFVNQTFWEFFGKEDEDFSSDRWVEVLHPEDGSAYLEKFQDSLRLRTAFHARVRVRRSDGTWRWMESHGRPRLSETGEFLGMVGASFDVTETKLATDLLRERERELASLAENTPDILARFDRQFRFVFVNSAVTRATGLQPSDHLGKSKREIGMDQGFCDLWESHLQKVFQTGQPCELEFFFNGPTGRLAFQSRLVPEFRSNSREVEFVLAVTHDVTAQKTIHEELRRAKDSAESASKARDKFLAVLSHELRTPLSPVLLSSYSLAKDPSLSPAAREVMKMIQRNIKVEARLIDDLLDLSRVLNGKLLLDLEPLSIHGILRHSIETCDEEIRAKKIDLRTDFQSAKDVVRGDSARLQQVFWNLLKNAIKFTPPGGIIEVATRQFGAEEIEISVRDSGIGIPEAALGKLFQPFEQAGDHITQQFGGLGLGLAICKGIIDLHEGLITAKSEGQGKGAEFLIVLPIGEAGVQCDSDPRHLESPEGEFPRKILVVEDHPDTAEAVAHLLRSRGFEVQTAHNGATAVEIASRIRFDLVLSDLGLPDFDGHEVIRRIHRLQNVPAVAMSGFGAMEDLSKSRRAGFSEHLIKPIDPSDLERSIQRVLLRGE